MDDKDENQESITADVAGLAGSLGDEQPEVSEHAVAIEQQKSDERKAAFADLKDGDGAPFDPSIHVTNADGEPLTTKTGKLRKRPGRKADGATRSQSHVAVPGTTKQDSGQQAAQELTQKRRQSGMHAARMFTSVAAMIGGEEWKPQKIEKYGLDEQESLDESLADYFEAKEMEDIPPGVALVMVVVSYMAPRFMMPKTKSRLGRLKDWIASKWFESKVKRKGGKVGQLKPEKENAQKQEQKKAEDS
jgi:hypothetical protein